VKTDPSAGVALSAASEHHAEALSELFARADVACHCRFWHFAGTNHEWLARCFHAPSDSKDEMRAALVSGSPEMRGVVATSDGLVVGWMKLAPESSVTKLYAQRVYRSLPCFGGQRDGVLALGCMLVDPSLRGRGIARRMLAFGIEQARADGARAIEAFPRRAAELRDDELLAGPFSTLVAHGFRVVHDFAPYPVLRLDLG
jgi:GNAT superfamily N-acetyltransferase